MEISMGILILRYFKISILTISKKNYSLKRSKIKHYNHKFKIYNNNLMICKNKFKLSKIRDIIKKDREVRPLRNQCQFKLGIRHTITHLLRDQRNLISKTHFSNLKINFLTMQMLKVIKHGQIQTLRRDALICL